jgi:hypothetical protein
VEVAQENHIAADLTANQSPGRICGEVNLLPGRAVGDGDLRSDDNRAARIGDRPDNTAGRNAGLSDKTGAKE